MFPIKKNTLNSITEMLGENKCNILKYLGRTKLIYQKIDYILKIKRYDNKYIFAKIMNKY